MKVLLVGNPNCGKTAVFNRLTHSNNHVGNFSGVTVKEDTAAFNGIQFIDSPGVYSLSPFTNEEKLTKELVEKGGYDVILNVVDATNLHRNLILTLDLIKQNRPIIVLLNFSDRLRKNGVTLNVQSLKKDLGVSAILISAKTGEGFKTLLKLLETLPSLPQKTPHKSIEEITKSCLFGKVRDGEKSEKIDKIVLNPILCYPILFSAVFLMLTLVFGSVGSFLSAAMSECLSFIFAPVSKLMSQTNAPEWVNSLITDAVLGGVGGVLSFLPQIALLFLLISLLEDSGYMARGVFLTDFLFSKIGLSGRAFIPMLMGLGCTTTAVMSSRLSSNKAESRLTALITPFVSCSAKLPVYAMFTSAFFKKTSALVIILIYLLGFVMAGFWGIILKKTAFKNTQSDFLMELPPYRFPSFRDTALSVIDKCKGFVLKASSVIFLTSVSVWVLQHFTLTLTPVNDISQSVLATFGKTLAPLLTPLGFGNWQTAVALICGMMAKESAVSAFLVLFSSSKVSLEALFTPASALSFMVFVLLSPPCISALTSIKNETESAKYTALSVIIQLITAYIISFLVYLSAQCYI